MVSGIAVSLLLSKTKLSKDAILPIFLGSDSSLLSERLIVLTFGIAPNPSESVCKLLLLRLMTSRLGNDLNPLVAPLIVLFARLSDCRLSSFHALSEILVSLLLDRLRYCRFGKLNEGISPSNILLERVIELRFERLLI